VKVGQNLTCNATIAAFGPKPSPKERSVAENNQKIDAEWSLRPSDCLFFLGEEDTR
jgi:hypothetical protein